MTLRLTSSALALAAMTMPALAEVTPEQVWQAWLDYYQSMGNSVTEGKRDLAGETLTLTDVVISSGTTDPRSSIAIPEITLSATGDGKVRTVLSEHLAGTVKGSDEDGGSFELPFTVDLPGNVITTSGEVGDMTHELDYPGLNLALSTITSEGKQHPLPVKLAVTDTTGTLHAVSGPPAKYDYALNSDKITFTGDFDDGEGERVKLSGSLMQTAFSGNMTLPAGIRPEEDMNAALKAGLAFSGVVRSGPLAGLFEFTGTGDDGQVSSGSGQYDGKGFELGYTLSQDGLGYQASADATSFQMTSSDLPFPIAYAVDSGGFDMQLPVMQSDQPQPFKFAYSLAGLTLGDAIWNMFDPGAKLPRDPASLDLDVTGNMRVIKDVFDMSEAQPAPVPAPADDTDAATAEGVDPDAPADTAEALAEAAEAGPETPFAPVDLTINQFALSALGARAHAEGMLKAAESGDMTAPIGQIIVTYEGLNGLIDTLASMGLIPEDQLTGVRMMLAMFAKPVAEGQDKLETRLEFREGGAIFANGQQIQ
ncbi:DUF2125 domain-containing protein [Paracoccus sp. (in: a-proteobacteria)]|uniref:DUF2125 domain-containing protein n=1 Tax=Paracoccus sp. TaxID=267 RepID=UPI0032200847